MKKQNQKGFSAIEGLLSLIAVALIVFVGYYIYHAQSKTTDTYNSSTEVAGTTVPQGTVKKATSPTANEFTIKEWGVEAPYSGNLGLIYDVPQGDNASNNTFEFTSGELNNSDVKCAATPDAGGIVVRYAPTDIVYSGDGDNEGVASKYFANYDSSATNNFSHVGNYYYQYQHPQAVCGDSATSNTIQDQTESAVNTIVKDLKAVSN